MGLALSTSWNALRSKSAKELLFEIEVLGFKEIELSFNLDTPMVEGIEDIAPKRKIRVVSLHNFCPVPKGLKKEDALPDSYSMSSLNENERKNAVKYTKTSIDWAERIGARALVLHCGRVEIPDRTKELIRLFREGKKGSGEFEELKKKAVKEREDSRKPFFENTLRSLEAIDHYARRKNIFLGVETRFYYREIPSLKEIGVILNTFKDSNLRYWHDTGHARVMEDLGFAKHLEYLKTYGKKMLGLHLHDTFKCQDHLAPSRRGDFDFALLKPYLKKDTLKVIEAHEPATPSELKESRAFLEAIFNDRT